MNQIVYDLSQATDFNKLVFINEESITDDSTDLINLNKTEIKLNNEVFKIVKYNKKTLNNDNIPTYGIYRSVIVNSDNKVVCFAPPKSINSDLFIQKYSLKDESLIAEEISIVKKLDPQKAIEYLRSVFGYVKKSVHHRHNAI